MEIKSRDNKKMKIKLIFGYSFGLFLVLCILLFLFELSTWFKGEIFCLPTIITSIILSIIFGIYMISTKHLEETKEMMDKIKWNIKESESCPKCLEGKIANMENCTHCNGLGKVERS